MFSYPGAAVDQHLLFAHSLHGDLPKYAGVPAFSSSVLEVANVTEGNIFNVMDTLNDLKQTGR